MQTGLPSPVRTWNRPDLAGTSSVASCWYRITEEQFMAQQPHPDDPYRVPNDPYRAPLADDDVRRSARLDNELQADPELTEGPASGSRMAMLAIAIAVILGAVFYGLNSSPVHQAGTPSTAQNTAQDSPPVAPPGMRDVTPRSNLQPGVTTGAAPANPKPLSPEPPATAGSDATNNGAAK
jgi:hypothetical protein